MEKTKGKQQEAKLDWQELLDEALTLPGDTMGVYQRFYSYSLLNCLLLYRQGVHEPVATYSRWQAMGRQVLKGSKAKEIVRPIIIEKKNDAGEIESKFLRFKPVRCLFTVSETEGEELPPVESPTWNLETALERLNISRVPFPLLDGNCQGVSFGYNIAINPVAKYPLKTTVHELGHCVLGHTIPDFHDEYRSHRGLKEWEAESTSYLTLNELELMTEEQATVSRGYVQNWMRGTRPPEPSIRKVFAATDKILKAGREFTEVEAEA